MAAELKQILVSKDSKNFKARDYHELEVNLAVQDDIKYHSGSSTSS